MCVNGLGQWDAMSDHRRCPIFYEILDRLETHYRETYGPESPEFLAARYSVERYPVGSYEPSVIEKVFNDLVRNESNITVELECFPESAEVTESNILSTVFKHMRNDSRQVVAARVFVDATYEGDLAAAAGVPYRVGREAAAEYDEPHGGFALTNLRDSEFPGMVAQGRLNIKLHGHPNGRIAARTITSKLTTCEDAFAGIQPTGSSLSARPSNMTEPSFSTIGGEGSPLMPISIGRIPAILRSCPAKTGAIPRGTGRPARGSPGAT